MLDSIDGLKIALLKGLLMFKEREGRGVQKLGHMHCKKIFYISVLDLLLNLN